MYDKKTKWDRIGYSLLFRKIARAIVIAGVLTTLLVIGTTALINKQTAELTYKNAIADIRYENIKH